MNEADDAALRRLAGRDLNLLVVFAALMRQRSVTRAAAQLFVGQPAVSASLKRLRGWFDDPLFVKAGRAIVATPRALALEGPVSALLAGIDSVASAAPEFDPLAARGTWRIGLSDDNEIVFLPAIAAELAQRAPNVRLVTLPVNHTDIRARLDAGDIALGVSVFGELSRWHPSQTLYEQGYGALYDPARHHAGRGALALADYLASQQVIVTFDGVLESKVDRALAARALQRDVRLGTTRFGTLPHLVAGTPRVASVPELVGRVLARAHGLAFCPLPLDVPPGHPRMAWHARDERDPAGRWLRALVAGCVERVVGDVRRPQRRRPPR